MKRAYLFIIFLFLAISAQATPFLAKAQTIPAEFHGKWKIATATDCSTFAIIKAKEYTTDNDWGMSKVKTVEPISDNSFDVKGVESYADEGIIFKTSNKINLKLEKGLLLVSGEYHASGLNEVYTKCTKEDDEKVADDANEIGNIYNIDKTMSPYFGSWGVDENQKDDCSAGAVGFKIKKDIPLDGIEIEDIRTKDAYSPTFADKVEISSDGYVVINAIYHGGNHDPDDGKTVKYTFKTLNNRVYINNIRAFKCKTTV